MLLNLSPLRRHRDFRLVFIGQTVSALGSFLTYVALPVQIYGLTKSSATVGLLGAVELVPLAITSLWGGALADALDRRRLLLWCEVLLLSGSLALAVNAMAAHPSVPIVFTAAALMSAVSGFHTPSLESLTPKLVTASELPARIGVILVARHDGRHCRAPRSPECVSLLSDCRLPLVWMPRPM